MTYKNLIEFLKDIFWSEEINENNCLNFYDDDHTVDNIKRVLFVYFKDSFYKNKEDYDAKSYKNWNQDHVNAIVVTDEGWWLTGKGRTSQYRKDWIRLLEAITQPSKDFIGMSPPVLVTKTMYFTYKENEMQRSSDEEETYILDNPDTNHILEEYYQRMSKIRVLTVEHLEVKQ